MQIHEINPKKTRKKKKRIGRGGKRGTYSGRGQKGQKSRAGRRIRSGLKDIVLRIPRLRGEGNRTKRKKEVVAIPLGKLNHITETQIDRKVLLKYKFISSKEMAKIVDGGILKSYKEIIGIPISHSAVSKINQIKGKK